MLDLMPDVGCGNVVIKAVGVVAYEELGLTLALVLPLDKLLLQIIVGEGLHKGAELFLLVVAGRPPGIHEDGRTDDCGQHFRPLRLPLADVQHDQQVEVYPFVVVRGRAEFYSAEVDLSVHHLHLALPSDPHIHQGRPLTFLVFAVLFDCENLSLRKRGAT